MTVYIAAARCLALLRNMKDKFVETIDYIVAVLKEAGYDPYDQLYAYSSTGNEAYITRKKEARKLAATLDRNRIAEYISAHVHL